MEQVDESIKEELGQLKSGFDDSYMRKQEVTKQKKAARPTTAKPAPKKSEPPKPAVVKKASEPAKPVTKRPVTAKQGVREPSPADKVNA